MNFVSVQSDYNWSQSCTHGHNPVGTVPRGHNDRWAQLRFHTILCSQ